MGLSARFNVALFLAIPSAILWPCPLTQGQVKPQTPLSVPQQTSSNSDTQSEVELRKGIDLTRLGRFQEAIPHFLAARGRVVDEYAASFNLALCYVATGQFQPALAILKELEKGGRAKAEVYSLWAQALVGNGQPKDAFEAFQKAVALDPKNERLYLLMADACMDGQEYELGLRVLDAGLQQLPESPRLHYEKGIFYSFLNEPDKSESELRRVTKIAPGSVIASLAAAQRGLLDGDTEETIRSARAGIRKDPENYILLAILGQALIRNGVEPGQPEFDEARTALEKSVAERPDYWVSQQALGQIYAMMDRLDDAIAHLEIANRLSPTVASVYSHLAKAYRKRGDPAQAQKMLGVLAGLNQQQAARYKLAPPDHMASYMGSREQ
jgi:tetratricopeptide (TPR) repeat protein